MAIMCSADFGNRGNFGHGGERASTVNQEAITDTSLAVEDAASGDGSAQLAAAVGDCNAQQAADVNTYGGNFRPCSGRKLLLRGN
eukprot:jgi/Chrzof1/12184/Cz06g24100.t1